MAHLSYDNENLTVGQTVYQTNSDKDGRIFIIEERVQALLGAQMVKILFPTESGPREKSVRANMVCVNYHRLRDETIKLLQKQMVELPTIIDAIADDSSLVKLPEIGSDNIEI